MPHRELLKYGKPGKPSFGQRCIVLSASLSCEGSAEHLHGSKKWNSFHLDSGNWKKAKFCSSILELNVKELFEFVLFKSFKVKKDKRG